MCRTLLLWTLSKLNTWLPQEKVNSVRAEVFGLCSLYTEPYRSACSAGLSGIEETSAACKSRQERYVWHLEEAQPVSREGPWCNAECNISEGIAVDGRSEPALVGCNDLPAASDLPQAQQMPNEAGLTDEMDNFDDFDWGEFDLHCQAACETVEVPLAEQKAAPPELPQDKEAILEDTCKDEAAFPVLTTDGDDLQQGGKHGCNSDPCSLPSTQLIDCKTTNAGIQVHK